MSLQLPAAVDVQSLYTWLWWRCLGHPGVRGKHYSMVNGKFAIRYSKHMLKYIYMCAFKTAVETVCACVSVFFKSWSQERVNNKISWKEDGIECCCHADSSPWVNVSGCAVLVLSVTQHIGLKGFQDVLTQSKKRQKSTSSFQFSLLCSVLFTHTATSVCFCAVFVCQNLFGNTFAIWGTGFCLINLWHSTIILAHVCLLPVYAIHVFMLHVGAPT